MDIGKKYYMRDRVEDILSSVENFLENPVWGSLVEAMRYCLPLDGGDPLCTLSDSIERKCEICPFGDQTVFCYRGYNCLGFSWHAIGIKQHSYHCPPEYNEEDVLAAFYPIMVELQTLLDARLNHN